MDKQNEELVKRWNWIIQPRSLWSRLLGAFLIFTIGIATDFYIHRVTGHYIAAITFIAAISITLWAGYRIGVVLTLAIILLADYFLIPPTGVLFKCPLSFIHFIIIIIFVSLINGLISSLKRTLLINIDLHKQTKESEARYKALTELSPEGIMVNLGDKFVFANQVALDLLKVKHPNEIIGTDIWRWCHPDDHESIRGKIKTCLDTGQRAPMNEERLIATDGSVVEVMITGSPLSYKGIPSIELVIVDIRETKLKEKELYNALMARDTFIGIASHELKTPLTSLRLLVGIFKTRISKQDPAAYDKGFIDRTVLELDSQIDRLSHLMTEMLDVSKISTNQFKIIPELIDVSTFTNEVFNKLLQQCGDDCLCIKEIETHIIAEIDRLRFEQIINNLLSNAIKYACQNPITLSLKSNQTHLYLKIADSGPGISKEHHEKIFQKFARVTSSKHTLGLGLGLYITKSIVEAHHGTITLESDIGKGCLFTVKLPLKQPKDKT